MNVSRIAKGYRPLCATTNGLLTYHNGSLYWYRESVMQPFAVSGDAFQSHITFRVLERIFRREPKSAVQFGNMLFIVFDKAIYQIDIAKHCILSKASYRKPYIHTSRLALIKDVPGFDDTVAYGEYFNNPLKEEVCIYTNSGENEWQRAYSFPHNTVRHIHTLLPDSQNSCVYIFTGDSDTESGIWKATDNFRKVVPLLVGSQDYRAVIGFVLNNEIWYATDIPSRKNKVMSLSLDTLKLTEHGILSGTCTTGCMTFDSLILGASVETKEPKNRGKLERIKYLLGYSLAEGIDDWNVRLMEYCSGKLTEIVSMKKDIFPVGLCQFGRINTVFDKEDNALYLYPTAVKHYDGWLCSINMGESAR